MANYRYLGYGITNEQGIATLDHDANGNPIDHSYTGTGAGELDIIASLDDSTKISDSSIQSEPYTVLDAIFKDRGTSSDYGTWNDTNFDGTIQKGDDYTTLTPADTYDARYKSFTLTDFCIEFDINATFSDGTAYTCRLAKNVWTSIVAITYDSLGLVSGEWSHIKLVANDNTLTKFVNGTQKGEAQSISDTITDFMIALNNTTTSNLKYKNFVIYPI